MKRVNAVVVGAGAAGGIVAKELATAGLSVVLLERGKWYTAADCRKDDLRNQRTTVLGNAFGPDDRGNPRVGREIARRSHRVFRLDVHASTDRKTSESIVTERQATASPSIRKVRTRSAPAASAVRPVNSRRAKHTNWSAATPIWS